MSNQSILFLETGVFLLVLFYGTHFIRTVSFNRYEAVTFECSSGSFLLSLLLIYYYGFSWPRAALAGMLLAGFVFNAFSQWHFYMVLQERIKKAFAEKAKYLEDQSKEAKTTINETLETMASIAIMPSFSRFIEESKLFNNPGSFIGLIKTIMKRQRFQKKKYQMRECFADNVNMIGPCKPMIGKMMKDQTSENVISSAIHANDLALDYPDEKKGLASFDFFGFGAMIAIWVSLACNQHSLSGEILNCNFKRAAWMCLLLTAFTALSHVLRHFAFARYESFSYELCFSVLVAASFGCFEKLVSGAGVSIAAMIDFACVLILFLESSLINRSTDSALHKILFKYYSDIIFMIPPDSETNRTKRRFLHNLKVISEWAIVPFPGGGKLSDHFQNLLKKREMRHEGKKNMVSQLFEFETINMRKVCMQEMMQDLVIKVAPECKGGILTNETAKIAGRINSAKWYIRVLGFLSLAAMMFFVWEGVL